MPLLNNEQIRELVEIIKKHHNSYVFTNITRDLPATIIKDLQAKGLISRNIKTQDFMGDAYALERLREILKKTTHQTLSLVHAKSLLQKFPLRLTDTERDSINHIQQNAGKYITKQGDLLAGDLETIARTKNMELKDYILSKVVRDPLKEGIEKRKMVSAIASDMRKRSDDHFRNWFRVAHTELQNARNFSVLDGIQDTNKGKKDKDILVYKRPSPGACKYCKAVYLEDDGSTPKVFRLSDMKKNVSNFGLKSKQWQPTLEVVHPYCRCELMQIPGGKDGGWGFDEKGQIDFKGKKHKQKVVKPQPADLNLNLYDSQGNLKKAKLQKSLKKSPYYTDLCKSFAGKDKITVKEILEEIDNIKKSKQECSCEKLEK